MASPKDIVEGASAIGQVTDFFGNLLAIGKQIINLPYTVVGYALATLIPILPWNPTIGSTAALIVAIFATIMWLGKWGTIAGLAGKTPIVGGVLQLYLYWTLFAAMRMMATAGWGAAALLVVVTLAVNAPHHLTKAWGWARGAGSTTLDLAGKATSGAAGALKATGGIVKRRPELADFRDQVRNGFGMKVREVVALRPVERAAALRQLAAQMEGAFVGTDKATLIAAELTRALQAARADQLDHMASQSAAAQPHVRHLRDELTDLG